MSAEEEAAREAEAAHQTRVIEEAMASVPMKGDSAAGRPGQLSEEVEQLAESWLSARVIGRGQLKSGEWHLLLRAALVVVAHTPREQLTLQVAADPLPPAPSQSSVTCRRLSEAARARSMQHAPGSPGAGEWQLLSALLDKVCRLL